MNRAFSYDINGDSIGSTCPQSPSPSAIPPIFCGFSGAISTSMIPFTIIVVSAIKFPAIN